MRDGQDHSSPIIPEQYETNPSPSHHGLNSQLLDMILNQPVEM